ncbi:MAG: putative toxin-antitoxin system toxin component, PIN family [Caldilineales bacterium]|nr:putative toxin-antitoxin system toxin component, PIN family [Caldilineales bacterium]MCW5857150.1 putative toxin-antitoxin system toxin component, PIN family [Caldilineales bacterium]
MKGQFEVQESLIVVFDTNAVLPLLVGATFRARRLRELWQSRRFEVCITPQTLAEVERVLTYAKVQENFGLTDADIQKVTATLQSHARLLAGLYEGVTAIRADPSDNIFLAAVLEAGADYLVTQDGHLRRLKYYHGTQIISLAQFAMSLGIGS